MIGTLDFESKGVSLILTRTTILLNIYISFCYLYCFCKKFFINFVYKFKKYKYVNKM